MKSPSTHGNALPWLPMNGCFGQPAPPRVAPNGPPSIPRDQRHESQVLLRGVTQPWPNGASWLRAPGSEALFSPSMRLELESETWAPSGLGQVQEKLMFSNPGKYPAPWSKESKSHGALTKSPSAL